MSAAGLGLDHEGSPRAALELIAARAAGRAAERQHRARLELEQAALATCGEVGYRRLTVQRILDRTALNRARFYKSFANKDECYASAHAAGWERLIGELLVAGAAGGSWLSGFRCALERLAAFAEAEPLIAKGLLAEAHLAGPGPVAKRNEVFERLSRAIDSARRETVGSRHSPPPIAASFILAASEAAVVRSLLAVEEASFREQIGSLTYLAGVLYFGEEAADEALRSA